MDKGGHKKVKIGHVVLPTKHEESMECQQAYISGKK